MTVTERLMGVGQWELPLVRDTPRSVLDQLDVRRRGVGFGHVVITSNPMDITLGDAILSVARYTGVYRKQPSEFEMAGAGLAAWIGDEDGKGPAFIGRLGDSASGIPTGSFAEWADTLRPNALTAGFTSSISGGYGMWFHRTGLRKPLEEICDVFGAEWRVNPDFSFDIGTPADLFRLDPEAVIVRRKGDGGRDFNITGIVGDLEVERDLEDWVRRAVHYLGTGEAPVTGIGTGSVAALDVPYRRPDGQAIDMDILIEDFGGLPDGISPTDAQNAANAEAAKDWARLKNPHQELTVSSITYDIGNDVQVGDNLYVYDRLRGIYEEQNPIQYRGQTIYPEIIRCVGLKWPIRRGMGVYFRGFEKGSSSWNVTWLDLTNFVDWEDGETTVEVGDKPRTS